MWQASYMCQYRTVTKAAFKHAPTIPQLINLTPLKFWIKIEAITWCTY